MGKYTDLFIDFDDTLYDTYGNAVIALEETFRHFHLERYFDDPQVFYDAYWQANIELWSQYAKGEITRDYLILERFRRPLMACPALHSQLLNLNAVFLDYCSSKPGVVAGAHELMDYLNAHRSEAEAFMENIRTRLSDRLRQVGIACSISGRIKHVYSIYRKMQAQHKTLDEIFDIMPRERFPE